MKTSIATVSSSGDPPKMLSAICAAAFRGVEIFEQNFIAFHGSAAGSARVGLTAAVNARPKDPNVLYEEAGEGRFHPLCCKPNGKGFAFEIVERQARYCGCGTESAPIGTVVLRRELMGRSANAA